MDDATQPPADASPPIAPAPAPATDGSGAGATDPDPALVARVEQASAAAIAQHLDEAPKRKGRGPDKRPRKLPSQCLPRLPVESLGNGAAVAPGVEGAPAPLTVAWDTPTAGVDTQAVERLVKLGVKLINKLGGAIVRTVALNELGDEKLATEAAAAAQMDPDVAEALEIGSIECARKYGAKMEYAPEVMFLGGLGAYALTLGAQLQGIRAKGRELKQQTN